MEGFLTKCIYDIPSVSYCVGRGLFRMSHFESRRLYRYPQLIFEGLLIHRFVLPCTRSRLWQDSKLSCLLQTCMDGSRARVHKNRYQGGAGCFSPVNQLLINFYSQFGYPTRICSYRRPLGLDSLIAYSSPF